MPVSGDTAPLSLPSAVASDRGRAYAAAKRHSTRVRLLKFGIPAGALVAGGVVAAATFYNPLGQYGNLSLGGLSLNGTQITMENPRLTGFRKDARGYEVTAKTAQQDVRKPGLIDLKDMRARLATDEAGSFAKLVTNSGLFDSGKEKLELTDEVRITTSRGEEVTLKSASVDLKAGTVVSRQPVKIVTGSGSIEAEGLQVSDNGRTVSFEGRVRTQFHRIPDPPATSAAPGTASRVSQAESVVRR